MSECDENKYNGTYVGEVLARVRTTRLLAGRSGSDGLRRALEEVAELEGLDEVTE